MSFLNTGADDTFVKFSFTGTLIIFYEYNQFYLIKTRLAM